MLAATKQSLVRVGMVLVAVDVIAAITSDKAFKTIVMTLTSNLLLVDLSYVHRRVKILVLMSSVSILVASVLVEIHALGVVEIGG